MTTIENNPYYQGIGTYQGEEAQIYYDHHKQIWEIQLTSNNEWIENVIIDDIEVNN